MGGNNRALMAQMAALQQQWKEERERLQQQVEAQNQRLTEIQQKLQSESRNQVQQVEAQNQRLTEMQQQLQTESRNQVQRITEVEERSGREQMGLRQDVHNRMNKCVREVNESVLQSSAWISQDVGSSLKNLMAEIRAEQRTSVQPKQGTPGVTPGVGLG